MAIPVGVPTLGRDVFLVFASRGTSSVLLLLRVSLLVYDDLCRA